MPNPGTSNGPQSIDYITIASTGNATDFGDAAHLNRRCAALANDTRSVKAGGAGVNDDLMEYVTIASTGNTTSFGDLLASSGLDMGAGSNTTRGIYYVNYSSNTIQYITIASTGNATDFGDASQLQRSCGSSNSSTRVFVGGGYNTGGSVIANIEYVTTASLGNGTDFGDLTVARSLLTGCSDKIRGLFASGFTSGGANQDVIDYITMASSGNATDFGDLHTAIRSYNHTDISSAHGGLA